MNAAPPVADSHNDLLLACLHRFERGHSDPFGDDWLPGLRAGGVVFQVLPIFTEHQFIGEGALRRTLEVIDHARHIAEVHKSDVAIVESGGDIQPVLDAGKIALLIALEGAEPVGSSVAMFETMWRLGVRMASLTWNRRTMMADGIGETDTGGRLTTLGIEAISELERLGMIVDISHLSAPGVDHLAEIAQRPFVASHSSCRELVDHPRNLTDRQLRLVAASGGFVAMNGFGPFLASGQATIDDFIDHLMHAGAVIGHDRVAIGADMIDDLVRQVDPILGKQLLVDPNNLRLVEGFKGPADYANVSKRLYERVEPEVAEAYLHRNMLDFFSANLPHGRTPVSRASGAETS